MPNINMLRKLVLFLFYGASSKHTVEDYESLILKYSFLLSYFGGDKKPLKINLNDKKKQALLF